jgi:hypothetical protein
MPIFRTPYVFGREPRFHPNDVPAAKRIRSFYRGGATGVTVYILVDNSVTTVLPYDTSTIRTTYIGGYLHEVSDADATLLSAAGFDIDGDFVIPVDDGDDDSPTPGTEGGYALGYAEGF